MYLNIFFSCTFAFTILNIEVFQDSHDRRVFELSLVTLFPKQSFQIVVGVLIWVQTKKSPFQDDQIVAVAVYSRELLIRGFYLQCSTDNNFGKSIQTIHDHTKN